MLGELLAATAEAGVRVALLGGYAVVTWGIPRATYDVDVLIEADDGGVARCLAALERHGFGVDSIYKTGWRDRVRDMPLVEVQAFRGARPTTGDLFLVTTPLQQSAFARRLSVRVPGLERDVAVITPADPILFELLADRPKDRLDVQDVPTVQGVPGRDYLHGWAKRLGVESQLEQAVRAAGLETKE